MQVQEVFSGSRIDDVSFPATPREQQISHVTLELSAEPERQRNSKSALRPVDHFIGKNSAHRFLENALSARATELQLRRNRCRELDHLVIEERHTHFE